MAKKIKVIIDTDPGVDDAACLVYALHDKRLDVKLLTTVVGNVSVDTCTRNLCHILDKFGLNYPVAKGAAKALCRESPFAEHVHSKEGLGGYIPPEKVDYPILKEDAVEAMYRVLSEGNGDIIPLVLGPHTNIALLLQKHPDIIKKIPKIIFMGGSPYGVGELATHISFNISSDPEAFKIVLDSKIPLVMVPSSIGRNKAYISERYAKYFRKMNEVGAFLFEMYDEYWERGYKDKRLATNDTCAYMYLIHPICFRTRKISLTVDTDKEPGKTVADFRNKGHVTLVTGCDRNLFLMILNIKLHKFDKYKFKKNN